MMSSSVQPEQQAAFHTPDQLQFQVVSNYWEHCRKKEVTPILPRVSVNLNLEPDFSLNHLDCVHSKNLVLYIYSRSGVNGITQSES